MANRTIQVFFIYHKNSIKGADDEHKYQYYKKNMEYNIAG